MASRVSELRLRLDSEPADEVDQDEPDDSGCLEFPQQQPPTPPPPPRPTRAEQQPPPPAQSQSATKKPDAPTAELSFQEQLRRIAFGGSRQKRPTASGGSIEKLPAAAAAAAPVEKATGKASVASSAIGDEDQRQPSTLDLIARVRSSLTTYQTAAPPPPAAVENDVDDYNRYYYREAAASAPVPAYPADDAAYDYRGGDGSNGFNDEAVLRDGGIFFEDDPCYDPGVGSQDDFDDVGLQRRQQQPGSMLREVRARWAAQREEEVERLKEMSNQRQLETQLREECRQLNENLYEKQREVQAMADQLDLLRRLNEQTKSDLMAAVEKGDFQASELKLVMEEDRQVLEATRRENLELKSKMECDELEMRGLEGRLAGLERQLQSMQSENGRLAQQMRETSLSVQAGAMERQEAGRLGQQLVALETELLRLRREVANQHLVGSQQAAAVAAAAVNVAAPTKLPTTTATASTMTTPRVAAVEQPACRTTAGPSRLQRALEMSITGTSAKPSTAAYEPAPPATQPPPPPPRQKQQPQPTTPPPAPRLQRSAEDEQISDRVRGFLTRMQTPPATPKPQQQQQQQQPMSESRRRQLRPVPIQRLQQLQQQKQQQQQTQQSVFQSRQQPQIRRPIRTGSFGAGGSGGSIVERLRAEFRDAHSSEIKRLAAASTAASPSVPAMASSTAAPQNPQLSWRPPAAQQLQQPRRSAASSMTNILQGLEAMNSFRSGAGAAVGSATSSAVPRLSLESGAGGETGRSDTRWNHLRDYAEARELTASARKYADSLVTKYLSQQGAS
ncbi:hypothetical protein BOX15_Mlig021042g3 [Macrostomum lignano]|uniref:Uncharacterized protein n=2 Tax=Macrostomum lignano TaxID=282301 RepID=A0A267E2J2_9PLAT|nr:hypothetical protein BOX15_Mlig021042g3 [Macrostomum lignano]